MKKPLSASKIKTLQSCSWTYWCNYHLKLPDDGNDGASRGTICHLVFEVLGNKRHHHHFKQLMDDGNVWQDQAIANLIRKNARALNVDDSENLNLINDMIMNGLEYDFYALEEHGEKPCESISERDFNLVVNEEGEGKKYSIRGFIDKLFLWHKIEKALIRDFKTSKSVFTPYEQDDNVQELMYDLAVKKLYPHIKERQSEFVFLKFDLGNDLFGDTGSGVVKNPPACNNELGGFEYFLTEIQEVTDNFTEEDAKKDLAKNKPWPSKEEGFKGPLNCGFAKFPGQLKKDGTKMWHCAYKFAFDYWKLMSEDGKVLKTSKSDDLIADEEGGEYIEKAHYGGCPAHFQPHVEKKPVDTWDWLDDVDSANDEDDEFTL